MRGKEKKKGKEATEISGMLRRRDEGASKTSADWQRKQRFFFPLKLFRKAVRKAKQARLSLIHSKRLVSHLGKEALEATVLFFHLHKKDNADKLESPSQAIPTCTTK